MLVSNFDFDLPDELIAQHPPARRGDSRMLVMNAAANTVRDAHFCDLPNLLSAGDLLVLNDSRVMPARLYAQRVANIPAKAQPPTGVIEVLLTEQINNGNDRSAENVWRALVKPGRKVRTGDTLHFFAADNPHTPALVAEVIGAGEHGERTLRFKPVATPNTDFNAVLDRIGHMPLPPYIRHGTDAPEDRERYQTVYARQPGSAAAPTAGLHVTPEILDALRARGVEIACITLHVGLGTFQPVRVERVEDVQLHAERYTLSATTADAIKTALREHRRIIAVGTTTTRTLEHIAREAIGSLTPQSHSTPCEPPDWIDRIAPHSGSTSIFIAPGHSFRIVSGLLTNFHLPQSTLLMLVSAFAGRNESDPDTGRRAVLAAYVHAIRERYRFFSYGDCMLIL